MPIIEGSNQTKSAAKYQIMKRLQQWNKACSQDTAIWEVIATMRKIKPATRLQGAQRCRATLLFHPRLFYFTAQLPPPRQKSPKWGRWHGIYPPGSTIGPWVMVRYGWRSLAAAFHKKTRLPTGTEYIWSYRPRTYISPCAHSTADNM